MTGRPPAELVARSGSAEAPVELAGSLWLPDGDAAALLVMHPGSGPSDRDNDVFFPPIRAALLRAGVAVASFDKRGVGRSTGSWQEVGIEEQAADLGAALEAAAARVPDVPAGVFGHSQGGWVALEASRRGSPAPAFVVTSSGPAVPVLEQERSSARSAVAALPAADREAAYATADAVLTLAEDGAPFADLVAWVAAHPAGTRTLARAWGDAAEITEEEWTHLVRLGRYDPVPALRGLAVPLLAVFGEADTVTPVAASVAVLRREVVPRLLTTVVLPGGDHRMGATAGGAFVPGYPDVVVAFALDAAARRAR